MLSLSCGLLECLRLLKISKSLLLVRSDLLIRIIQFPPQLRVLLGDFTQHLFGFVTTCLRGSGTCLQPHVLLRKLPHLQLHMRHLLLELQEPWVFPAKSVHHHFFALVLEILELDFTALNLIFKPAVFSPQLDQLVSGVLLKWNSLAALQ